MIAEVYPALWSRNFPPSGRSSHQHDAFAIADWLRHADANGTLEGFFSPQLDSLERKTAEVEGWILGVV